MTIAHKSYFDGKVQSLGFITQNGHPATIGVIDEAGDWNFGTAERREVIQVTSGVIAVSDQVYRKGSENLIFNKGEEIVFSTEGPATYLCVY